ncbi:MAG: hypothetical protein ACTSVU_08280 [Promethearchaeota archaeon]
MDKDHRVLQIDALTITTEETDKDHRVHQKEDHITATEETVRDHRVHQKEDLIIVTEETAKDHRVHQKEDHITWIEEIIGVAKVDLAHPDESLMIKTNEIITNLQIGILNILIKIDDNHLINQNLLFLFPFVLLLSHFGRS